MHSDQRGRLTVPDVLLGLFAMAFLGALYPVLSDGMAEQSAEIPTGAGWLLELFLPLLLLVFLSIIYVQAAS
jgi:cytochrome c biogenesis factor